MDGKRRMALKCMARGGERRETLAAAPTVADRLSGLPDEVLLSVVCHLPVREVVRMSILSRRWRRLPSLLPVLDLLDLSSRRRRRRRETEDEAEGEELDSVAYWGLIRRCVLSSREMGERWVFGQWVEAISGKGIRELELQLDGGWDEDAYPVLQHCKSLAKLKLVCCSLVGRPAGNPLNIGCTVLRELVLEFVDVGGRLFGGLISSCLRLEILRIWDCLDFGRLEISGAPCLRHLEFGYHDPDLESEDFDCDGVDIDAPNLESVYIGLVPWWCDEFSIRSPKLTSLRIHLIDGEEDPQWDESEEERSPQEESDEDGANWRKGWTTISQEGFLEEESGKDQEEECGEVGSPQQERPAGEDDRRKDCSPEEESDRKAVECGQLGPPQEESDEEEEGSEDEDSLLEDTDEVVEESEEEGSPEEEWDSDEAPVEWRGGGPPHRCRVVAEALRRLLDGATRLRSVHLSGTSIRCLSLDVPPKSFRSSFVSLTRLGIELSLRDEQQASCLAMLLRHCHRLQVLKLYVSALMTGSGSSHKKVPFRPALVFLEHRKMLEQMGCLSDHLKEVTMYGLRGDIYEVDLACFFLMEARALKRLSLNFRTGYTKAQNAVATQLRKLRRGSPEVELEFDAVEYMIY